MAIRRALINFPTVRFARISTATVSLLLIFTFFANEQGRPRVERSVSMSGGESLHCNNCTVATNLNGSVLDLIPSKRKNSNHIIINGWFMVDMYLSERDNIYQSPLFPSYPSLNKKVSIINDKEDITDLPIRHFWLCLRPRQTGYYLLRILVQGCFSLNVKEHYRGLNQSKMESIYFFKWNDPSDPSSILKTHTSKQLKLHMERSYLISLLHWIKSTGRIRLEWKPLNGNKFEIVSGNTSDTCIKREDNSSSLSDLRDLIDVFPQRKVTQNLKQSFYLWKTVQLKDIQENVQTCDFKLAPSINSHVKLYSGWRDISEGRFYPNYHLLPAGGHYPLLKKKTVLRVVNSVWNIIRKETHRRGSKLERIVNIEEKTFRNNQKCYFVEFDLKEKGSDLTMRFSDYFLQGSPQSALCHSPVFTWQRNAKIYLIFSSSRKRNGWMLSMLDAISKIQDETKDDNLIVVLSNSLDVDWNLELQSRKLKYILMPNIQAQNVATEINTAIGFVPGSKCIVVTFDDHLQVPGNFFDEIRKVGEITSFIDLVRQSGSFIILVLESRLQNVEKRIEYPWGDATSEMFAPQTVPCNFDRFLAETHNLPRAPP